MRVFQDLLQVFWQVRYVSLVTCRLASCMLYCSCGTGLKCVVVQWKRQKLAVGVSVDLVPAQVPVRESAAHATELTSTFTRQGVRGAPDDPTVAGTLTAELDTSTDMCTTQERATTEDILTVVCITVGPKDGLLAAH